MLLPHDASLLQRDLRAVLVLSCGLAQVCVTGCAPEDKDGGFVEGAVVGLNLRPLLPSNQESLFSEADTVELIVENSGAEDQVYTLSGGSGGGAYLSAEGLSDLVDVPLEIRGSTGGTTQFLGRSRPVTSGEDTDVNILVARANDFGMLGGLKKPTWGGAAASDGNGRYYFFGGIDETTRYTSGAYDKVQVIDLASPEDGLKAIYAAESLPPISEEEPGRVGLTATYLSGNHKDAGKILIVGGAKGIIGTAGMSETTWLFDPATESFEELPAKAETRIRGFNCLLEGALVRCGEV